MAGENLKSTPVTNLDASPIIMSTRGEGAPGRLIVLTDVVLPTASVAQWSTYRLCRMPTTAKVKQVLLYTSGIDSNATATAKLDVNIAFSDSTTDGTPVSYQGTIPSSKLDGTSLAFVAGTGYNTNYANSGTGNKLFGSAIAVSNSGAVQNNIDITFNNVAAFTTAMRDTPLWNVLGFVNAQGVAQDPGGFFDLFIVVEAAVATAHTGVLAAQVSYIT